jgi:glycosyltransferase involved in cell wall biosynthesis
MTKETDEIELTILMPCLNEEETIGICIEKSLRFLEASGTRGEVLIADNGSSDGSREIARSMGARVVSVKQAGYGAALRGGIEAAKGRFVIMGDADDSYDFLHLDAYMERLREGYELVMGNRFAGGVAPGAMPPLHRYIGNPVLSFVGRLFFKSPIRDFHCGLRGFNREAILRLGLVTPGMEFASEMVVKATISRLRIAEVPTTLKPDGRGRAPHLRSWRDGWRHLRFLLIYSPRWLFLYPGLFLFAVGLIGMVALMTGPVSVGSLTFDIHTMLFSSLAVVIGYQAIQLGVFSRFYGAKVGLLPVDPDVSRLVDFVTLERGLVIGLLLIAGGTIGAVVAILDWGHVAFGALDPGFGMRIVIPSATAIALGGQLLFGAFFLGVLRMRTGIDD